MYHQQYWIEWPEVLPEGQENAKVEKGRIEVSVRFADGRRYGVSFYSPAKLRQILDGVVESEVVAIGGLVVVATLTSAVVEGCIKHMVETGTIEKMPRIDTSFG